MQNPGPSSDWRTRAFLPGSGGNEYSSESLSGSLSGEDSDLLDEDDMDDDKIDWDKFRKESNMSVLRMRSVRKNGKFS